MNEIVIYRINGKENFKWRKILKIFKNHTDSNKKAEEIRKMGYKTLILTEKEFKQIGLPKSYNADEYFFNIKGK